MSIERLSTTYLTRNTLSNIQKQMIDQNTLIQQISTNKKILKPSDDPIGISKVMSTRNQLIREEEYQKSINVGEIWTNITSTALGTSNTIWQRVNELAISAVDGTRSEADLQGIALELDQLLHQLVNVSNTENSGLYIFGGSHTIEPPFQSRIDSETGEILDVYFTGNSFQRSIKTSNSGQVSLNVLGSNAGNPNKNGAFIDSNKDLNVFDTLIKLRDKLNSNDLVGISGTNGILNEINEISTNLSLSQVQLGGTQQILEFDQNYIQEQKTNLNTTLANTENIDIAQVILELNNVQNVYEAALAAGGRILSNSLLNYI